MSDGLTPAQRLGLSLAGKITEITSSAVAFDAANDGKSRQCLDFPWNLDQLGETLTINLDPAQTTDIANNKAGLDAIEYVIFSPDVASAKVTITLPGSPTDTGTAAFNGPPLSLPPYPGPKFYIPTGTSQIKIERKISAIKTEGTCYIYGYVTTP